MVKYRNKGVRVLSIKKKPIGFIFCLIMILSFIPTIGVQAITKDNNIISKSEVTEKEAKEWAEYKGATETFINLADLYFEYYSECGDVNPSIAYVQAAKETNFGKFGGVINESYHNTCGLKIAEGGDNNDPKAHKIFDDWDEGVQAHLDHLALYAGAKGYPKDESYDPRHFITIKGQATTVGQLGGKWAPSTTYGEEINKLYNDLLVYSSVEEEKKSVNDDYKNSLSTQGPGIAEIKPQALNAAEVLLDTKNNTPSITSTIGWKNKNGVWYYFNSNNTKATSWIKPDSDWYYLKSDGQMATGWVKENGIWYYFKSSGAMAKGWINEGNNWYYLQGDGAMVTGLNKIDNKNYLFDNNGNMKTGWQIINSYSYYFGIDGAMTTGFISVNGSDYYLYDTGAMARGWVNISGSWYYFKSDGTMVKGWINTSDESYYLEQNTGRMLTNTIIDGYKLDSDGKKQSLDSEDDTLKNNSISNNKKTIAIDPGHNYGGDRGAESTIDGRTYEEVELNMEVSLKLKTELEERGYDVVMTREEGDEEKIEESQSLKNRVIIANNAKADFFVSIHHNSASGIQTAKGVETYYSSAEQGDEFKGGAAFNKIDISKKMATIINNNIVKDLNLNNRGIKDSSLFIRSTNMPSVLVEVGFITNEEEAERCSDSKSQQKVAEAIADAIDENFNNKS